VSMSSVTPPPPSSRVQWLSDLIRLEIALWERIDARLRAEQGLSLAFFECLFFISCASSGSLRVGDLAHALRVTVGGTSKLVDRVEGAGLIQREPDPDDRRASRVALTDEGNRVLAAATATYEAELAAVLDSALSRNEQRQMHALVTRLLSAMTDRGSSSDTSTGSR
jgi:DNA-binding MarR family transcriptional regulator